jgi:hypothetical protein
MLTQSDRPRRPLCDTDGGRFGKAALLPGEARAVVKHHAARRCSNAARRCSRAARHCFNDGIGIDRASRGLGERPEQRPEQGDMFTGQFRQPH